MAGLVLVLDGIGLAALCLAADRFGIGQGYGLGPKQMLGLAISLLLAIAGLSLLLVVIRHRPETEPPQTASEAGERLAGASETSAIEKR
ncbi:MAG: hypothetical protein EXS64_12740 [Candidatus Latescibacteria bacterium]|nr:hypothetical protein [Candidatus Latescibacterota bacterium]